MATAQLLQELQQKAAALEDKEVKLLERFIEVFRENRRAQARTKLLRLLEKRATRTPPLSDAEVEQLANEAVRWARGQARGQTV